jgi:hypothetical protein
MSSLKCMKSSRCQELDRDVRIDVPEVMQLITRGPEKGMADINDVSVPCCSVPIKVSKHSANSAGVVGLAGSDQHSECNQ